LETWICAVGTCELERCTVVELEFPRPRPRKVEEAMSEKIDVSIADPSQVPSFQSERAIGSATVHRMSPALGTDEIKINAVYFEPGSRFPPHSHSYDQVLYYQYGTGVVAIDGGDDIIVPEGSYVLLPANRVHMHGCTADGPALHLSLMRDTPTDFDAPCPDSWLKYREAASR
jgi:quercetin dioxygenase-like cupin family protein